MSACLVVVGDVTSIYVYMHVVYICVIVLRVCVSTSYLHSFVSSFFFDVRLVDEGGKGH